MIRDQTKLPSAALCEFNTDQYPVQKPVCSCIGAIAAMSSPSDGIVNSPYSTAIGRRSVASGGVYSTLVPH